MTNEHITFKYKETPELLKSIKAVLVDDEKITVKALKMFLDSYIDDLYSFSDPKEAISFIETNEIDLLITDFWMPNINGIDLIKFAKNKNPDVATILLTVDANLSGISVVNAGVDKYIQKPAFGDTLLSAIEEAINKFLLKKIVIESQQKDIELMRLKERYSIFQQEEAYKKQLNIIKNELYLSTINSKITKNNSYFYIKTSYKPFEILSGDCYSIRVLSPHEAFIFILDIMGKGISASVTSITSTTYLNHLINTMGGSKKLTLKIIINKFLRFIKPILIEDEILCGLFLILNFQSQRLQFVNFCMPPLFFEENDTIQYIPAEELPITKRTEEFHIQEKDISNITKLILLSDGIVESKTINKKPYIFNIKKDIRLSYSLKNFMETVALNISKIPDDSTVIFIKKCSILGCFHKEYIIPSRSSDIDNFLNKLNKRLQKIHADKYFKSNITTILMELLANAHEHGNLGITSELKDKLISEDMYEKYILEKEKATNKEIKISFTISVQKKELYLTIEDQGIGFDKNIFENNKNPNFCGYGMRILDTLTKDFFYNKEGNIVTAIVDLSTKCTFDIIY
ncbi:MAG: response regulator [Calditerrivibrio sp.]|nr:response regulator [Calditerrivibrio sp.]